MESKERFEPVTSPTIDAEIEKEWEEGGNVNDKNCQIIPLYRKENMRINWDECLFNSHLMVTHFIKRKKNAGNSDSYIWSRMADPDEEPFTFLLVRRLKILWTPANIPSRRSD